MRKKNLKNDEQFKKSIEEKKNNRLSEMHEITKKEMVDEIQNFEGTLQKMGLSGDYENEENPEM